MPSPEPSSPSRLKRWLSTVAVAGVVIAAGSYAGTRYFHFSPVPQAAHAAAPEQAVPVTVSVIEPRKASLWDEFSGRLEAVERVEVRPRVAGAILATNFTEGSLVKAGDVLFKIDPAPYAAEVDRAQAQLEAARARASFAANELERGAQLVGSSIVTKRDFDQRDNGNREAIANAKAAEAALQAAKLNLDYTQVRAPVDGRVGRIEVTVGNLVAAGSASPVLTNLVSVNPIYASFDATEDVVLRALAAVADASGKRGNLDRIPVEMTTSGGITASGHIQLIDNQVQGQTGTIRVRAVFKNETGTLIPGQFARVRMGQPQQQSLVLLDERAIGTDQDKKFVMVVGDDERAVYRPVTLGGSVEGLRIISAGLKPGERVVVNGLQRVRPGALLKTQVAAMGARDGADTKQMAQR
ncbi:efflux RND transporter periplasmic adaptor subunit [Bradyrhizobium sp. HKCCYLR20261]|uniref:efflux RND transporter periplasmic adaptor subunit n=1 Tax=Bradyrhizobium sp. HKCCYLR20261 TaxID=3420760 RepID=UPI003EB7B4F0